MYEEGSSSNAKVFFLHIYLTKGQILFDIRKLKVILFVWKVWKIKTDELQYLFFSQNAYPPDLFWLY